LEGQVTRDAASEDIFKAEGMAIMGIQANYGMSQQGKR
jgi:hypothetical protein